MGDKIRTKLLLTTVIVALLFSPVTGLGGGKIDLEPLVAVDSETELTPGKVKIVPMVTVSSRMDSNFHKSESDEKDVYTYGIHPGIKVGYETAKTSVLLGYSLDATYYDGDPDDYLGHTGTLSARTKPFARLMLGLEDSFYKTRDPARSDKLSNSVTREKYFINRMTPSVLYEFENKFSLGLRYRNTVTEYDSSSTEGSVEHRGMLDLIYNFTPTTHLDFQYSRWKRNYDMSTSDYTSDQLKLIFAKQFRLLSVEAGMGYHHRNFSRALGDMDTLSYQLAALWESEQGSRLRFTAEQNFNDSGAGDAYFKETRFSLNAGRNFGDKISADIEGRYGIIDYETDDRKDDKYSLSANLSYMLNKWLTFNVGTGYEERDSNQAGHDYENKYVMGNIDYHYDPASK